MNRRTFLQTLSASTLGMSTVMSNANDSTSTAWFKISLAEWSLHRALKEGKMTNLDFPKVARQEFGIGAVEYVNTFFMDKARDAAYLKELNAVCDGEGVRSLLIMCDREGSLGDPDEAKRAQTVENHHKWVDAAVTLGCHSIRVNAQAGNDGSFEDKQKRAADGLRRLTEYAAKHDTNVLVENHGGLSSNGAWLAGVMKLVDHPRCGTLPDFGNFKISNDEHYDRYQGVQELMPYAKAVSAKSHAFDEQGNETSTDFTRMLKIVRNAGYRGYVGIEYEGGGLDEYAGIRATKALLERVRMEIGE